MELEIAILFSIIFFFRPCEETPDPPVQVPCPKSYFPNETNETKYR